jgi:hypothetical protein
VSPSIDRAAGTTLAGAVRHFGSGQITNDEFESRIPLTTEANLHDIFMHGVWPLYDDLHEHKLSGNYAEPEPTYPYAVLLRMESRRMP